MVLNNGAAATEACIDTAVWIEASKGKVVNVTRRCIARDLRFFPIRLDGDAEGAPRCRR